MKKLILVAALAMAFGSAFAQSSTATTSSTASSSSTGGAANNAGNTQQIIFEGAPSTQNQNVTYGGTQTVNSNVTQSGTTTQNQNITGATTQELTGDRTERQVISGGTESVLRQEFGTQKIKNTPSVNGAPLTTSNDTCMGSSSGSVNVPGFGVGLGSTWTDGNCVMLKNSRELWNMGMRGAAMALMCTDAKNKEALEITGFICPQTEREQALAAQAAANQGVGANAQMGGQQYTDPVIRRRLGLPPLN